MIQKYNVRERAVLLMLSKCRGVKKLDHTIKTDVNNIITDICINILNGNIPINKKTSPILNKYKSVVAKFSNKSYKNKQQLLTGGFLNFILPIISLIFGALVTRK
jgi:hypothetical protein